MNTFGDALQNIKQQHPDLFDALALRPTADLDRNFDVIDIDIPGQNDLRGSEDIGRPELLPEPLDSDEWWDTAPDPQNFELDSDRSTEERNGFEGRPPVTGLETIAIYLPFHLYGEGDWGIRFFERPLLHFADRLYRECRRYRLRHTWGRVLKVAAYAIARHEFAHYLAELEALATEVKENRRVYRLYWDTVYKTTYPGINCLEETVANVWLWDNPVVKSHSGLRGVFRDAILRTPSLAYSRGAQFDFGTVHPLEDTLAAQVRTCVPKPASPPAVWGTLPRPYGQPWTRYENVTFSMDTSLGGRLGPVLNQRRLRKTIRIYHR